MALRPSLEHAGSRHFAPEGSELLLGESAERTVQSILERHSFYFYGHRVSQVSLTRRIATEGASHAARLGMSARTAACLWAVAAEDGGYASEGSAP